MTTQPTIDRQTVDELLRYAIHFGRLDAQLASLPAGADNELTLCREHAQAHRLLANCCRDIAERTKGT